MKTIYLILSSILLIFLAACSESESNTSDAANDSLKRTTIVSDSTPKQSIPIAKSYTFVDKVNVVVEDSRLEPAQVQQEIRNAIAAVMQDKGYTYEPDLAKADLVMGFLLALESGVSDQQLIAKFGLSPGLVSLNSDGRYEKATLVVGAMATDTETLYWKSMLQGFADFERARDESERRLDTLVAQMLSDLPQAGQ
ncbi:DUF4136 domain-containing protein [Motilimonas eburnea]|uniref:DUF4136 domain-containing protein n=1 Tax=Motilimonas eburnea TaxID=1737488 RepID=UPI001E4A727F|nr:DUF4136 domain-containing protein [Motilimonas eburnea]MCE2573518.1 DUF4136 domain-containing protein [Motilimonas eburnea]